MQSVLSFATTTAVTRKVRARMLGRVSSIAANDRSMTVEALTNGTSHTSSRSNNSIKKYFKIITIKDEIDDELLQECLILNARIYSPSLEKTRSAII